MKFPEKFKRDAYNEMLEWKKERNSRSGHGAKALELRGARQCGKTTLMNDFARENYKQVVSIHLGDEIHRDKVAEWSNLNVTENFPPSEHKHEYVYNLLRRFNEEFVDSADTVIIIDEIQESPKVHRLIRQIAWEFEAHLIISGSYLAFADHSKDYFIPAGAVTRLNLTPLTFVEFLGIFGDARKIYEQADLYGGSPSLYYSELRKLYEIYVVVGGYPEVIKDYLAGKKITDVEARLEDIVTIFSDESSRYMKGVIDKALFSYVLAGVADIMLREKKGHPDLVEELFDLCKKEEKLRVSREMIVHAVAWLEVCGVLRYASKSLECKFNNIVHTSRYYFADMGIAGKFLRTIAKGDALNGLLAENFAYLQLSPILKKQLLLPERPTFGVYKERELDFVVFNRNGGTSYGIEIKSGKDAGDTAEKVLKDKVLDYIVYAKGDTNGGKIDNKITIPLSLLGRFEFTDFTGKSQEINNLIPADELMKVDFNFQEKD